MPASREAQGVIISRGRRYVFVHIPKTGGTSLATALEKRAMRDDILIGDTPKAKRRKRRLEGVETRGRLWKHARLCDIDGLLGADELAGMFTFTLVRNPWDRIASYYHWLRAQGFDHHAVGLAKSLDFVDFVQNETIGRSLATATAASYMTIAAGSEQCSAYIRLEAFEQDAAPLFEHLGFSVRLPHLNRSAREVDYRPYYDKSAQAAVAAWCAGDIARFGYCF